MSLEAVAARCADPAIAGGLQYVLDTVRRLAGDKYKVAYCPSLVRGQGYYTGMVFEVVCPRFAGAVAGGGRYDNMVGKFLGQQVPAVGFSIGFERVCGILLEQGYQIPGAKPKIALLYPAGADFAAVLAQAESLRAGHTVTVLAQGKSWASSWPAWRPPALRVRPLPARMRSNGLRAGADPLRPAAGAGPAGRHGGGQDQRRPLAGRP